jgi:hypothetical protein
MAKQILFRLGLVGNGCVNFDDSKTQAFTLKKLGIIDPSIMINNNIKLAKKQIYNTGRTYINNKGEEKPIYDYKLKISADCLRHHIYEHDVEAMTQAIMTDENIYCNYLLSDVGLTRGYMFAKSVDGNTLKRKSPLTITDAIQTNNNVSNLMEVGSTTGERTDTSFFTVEKIGDVTYSAKGVIDLKTLAFVPADVRFDRAAVMTEWCEKGLIDRVLRFHYGDEAQYKIGYFTSSAKYLTNTFAEYGIMLGDKIVNRLVKHILTNILKLDIRRNTAWTKCESLEIKIVNDLIKDTFENEEGGWIKIYSENDINELQIICDSLFTEVTNEDLKRMKDIDEEYKKAEEERLRAKKEAREEAARIKEEKKLKKQGKDNE